MAKKTAKYELAEIMVCKDILEKGNGTFSLIDVYPKDIAVSKAPATLYLSLWVNFHASFADKATIEVKLSGKDVLTDEIIIPVNIAANETDNENIAVPIVLKNIVLNLIGGGEIKISYKTPKAKWKVARVIDMQVIDSA